MATLEVDKELRVADSNERNPQLRRFKRNFGAIGRNFGRNHHPEVLQYCDACHNRGRNRYATHYATPRFLWESKWLR
jgi:hypothetical protein